MKVDHSPESLMSLDPVLLRALIRERTHNGLEVQLLDAVAEGKPLLEERAGIVRKLLGIWEQRGLPTDGADFLWVVTLLETADRVARGEKVDLGRYSWEPLDADGVDLVERMIQERRSVRHWTDEGVPDEMIDRILEAALWAPHGCNLSSLRFLVVREKNEPGLFKGSSIGGGPVHIVVCQDRRVYDIPREYVADGRKRENNRVLDCGAAMQNMLLMTQALGLGGCWLTFTSDRMKGRLRERFDLPDYVEIVTYMDLGFPAQTPIPPGRMAVEDVVLARV